MCTYEDHRYTLFHIIKLKSVKKSGLRRKTPVTLKYKKVAITLKTILHREMVFAVE